MTNIIKKIKEIMGNHWSSDLKVSFFNDGGIVFEIYESEIPIAIDIKKSEVYLDCELYDGHLTVDMLQELHDVVKLLEDNIEVLREI